MITLIDVSLLKQAEESLRESERKLALVALSGYSKERLATDGEPFDHCLLKPLSIENVVDLLESLPG